MGFILYFNTHHDAITLEVDEMVWIVKKWISQERNFETKNCKFCNKTKFLIIIFSEGNFLISRVLDLPSENQWFRW